MRDHAADTPQTALAFNATIGTVRTPVARLHAALNTPRGAPYYELG